MQADGKIHRKSHLLFNVWSQRCSQGELDNAQEHSGLHPRRQPHLGNWSWLNVIGDFKIGLSELRSGGVWGGSKSQELDRAYLDKCHSGTTNMPRSPEVKGQHKHSGQAGEFIRPSGETSGDWNKREAADVHEEEGGRGEGRQDCRSPGV